MTQRHCRPSASFFKLAGLAIAVSLGFGLLGFNSVRDRDYPVVMGILTLSATLMLLGNILSDALVALVDPRVRFE